MFTDRLEIITVLALLPCVGLWSVSAADAKKRLLPGVEAEELVYAFTPAHNGAGPLWCFGSTCIVRIGGNVFVSGLETLKDAKPLNNVRWLLFKRADNSWELQQADDKGRQREPCPLTGAWDGRLFLSTNPTLTKPGTRNGPAQPQVLQFDTANPKAPYKTLLPAWEGKPPFTEHSYRAFCADGPNGELLLMNVLGHNAQYWSFRDRGGKWSKCGKLVFPMGVGYEKPEPIRLCYPILALRNRAAHMLAISDIIEPVKAWREYKLILHHGRRWDYDFRRLFYTWTPDITTKPFSQWVEIASREKTAGRITHFDLWVDPRGRVHVLWLDRSVWSPAMRAKFFPDVPITTALVHGVIEQGKLVSKTTLAIGGEGQSQVVPIYARFHVTADNRLFVFYYCADKDADGRSVSENRLMEIYPDGGHGKPVRVPLEHPFTAFMTATTRGGSPPSDTLEVLGVSAHSNEIWYGRIGLFHKVMADFTADVTRTPTGSQIALDGAPTVAVDGKIASWKWIIDDAPATGQKVVHRVDRGGIVKVTMTATDAEGHSASATRTITLPPAPSDFGLERWGLVLRTEAETYVAEHGGPMHVRTDKLNASALSLSHWNSKDHWLEWEVDAPRDDDYCLLVRYACPRPAARKFTLDGQAQPDMHFPHTGGYGSATIDNWGFVAFKGADGKPIAVHLAKGRHAFRLENQDGEGLNLDYLDWIAKKSPMPTQSELSQENRLVEEDGYRFVIPLHGTICPTRLTSDGGFCWQVEIGPRFPGDAVPRAPRSRLRMFEDGKEVGPAHAAHVDIRNKGLGRYSHWTTSIRFSASDNSDPRTNGRTYTWRIVPR